MKKVVFFVLFFVIFLLLMSVDVKAAEEPKNVGTQEAFYNALADIHNDSNKEYVISLSADITVDDLSKVAYNVIDNGNTVTILGNGHTLQFSLPQNDTLHVTGGTLNLGASDGSDVLNIKGPGTGHVSYDSLVIVTNGNLNMYKGVSLSDNYSGNSSLTGAAVRLNTNGIFNMYGGSIHDTECSMAEVGAAVTLDATGAKFIMHDGEIKNNSSVDWGGGIYVANNGEIEIKGGTISNNRGCIGGAISIAEGSAVISNATISDNSITNSPSLGAAYGGAILCNDNCSLTMTGCTLKNNSGSTGGAIYTCGECIIDNCIFEGNNGSVGGTICSDGTTTIKNSTFDGNNSSAYGGAILNYSGTIESENNTFKNNNAIYGGAFFNYSASSITKSKNDDITSNTATRGAGVYSNKGTIDFSTSKVYNNKATGFANDFYISASSSATIIDPTTINKAVTFDSKTCNINGWYEDGSGNRFSLTAPTDEVIYSSIATGTSYSLTAAGVEAAILEFDVDGGSDVEQQIIPLGGTATRPADPTKTGYKFINWYTSDTYETVYDFTNPINANAEIYAKWEENPADPTDDSTDSDGQADTTEPEDAEETESSKNTEKSPSTGDRGINRYIALIVLSGFGIYYIQKNHKRRLNKKRV